MHYDGALLFVLLMLESFNVPATYEANLAILSLLLQDTGRAPR